MVKKRIEYFSNNNEIISPCLKEYLERAKIIALIYSNEPDKTRLVFDRLLSDVTRWFDEHIAGEEL